MHIVKKMLFALRSGTFGREVIPSFTAALKGVVKSNFSTEVVRTLATFVTSFSQRGMSHPFQLLMIGKGSKSASLRVASNSPVKRSFTIGEDAELPRRKRKQSDLMSYEVVVLEMLVDILLSPEKRYVNKFATTITSKVSEFWVELIAVVAFAYVKLESGSYHPWSQDTGAFARYPRTCLCLQICCASPWISGSETQSYRVVGSTYSMACTTCRLIRSGCCLA